METQRKILKAIKSIGQEKNSEVCIIGDVFHTPRQPNELTNMVIDIFQGWSKYLWVYPGQHDLPYHQYENEHCSSYGILKRVFWELNESGNYDEQEKIRFTHQLTFPNKKEQIIINGKAMGKTAQDLLDEYPKAQWIFTGDYHRHFHYENKGRHVVNPGCITRQASDFIDYQPVIYYVDTEEGIVEAIELPDTEDMVTDQYIKDEKARNERIESFISTIQKQGEVSLNFIDNLRDKGKGLSEGSRGVLMEVIEEVV
jgi:DNA repair exonuclease SbcCD nuclease subunit